MTEPDKGPPPSPAAPAKPWWRWLLWPFVLLGVLATIVLLWLMVLVLDIGPGRNEQPVMAKTGAERRFVVGQIAPLDGTSLMAIEIAAADSNGAISSKGYGSDLRNVLLLDRSTGRSRRILPDNTRQISGLRYLPDGGGTALVMDGVSVVEETGEDAARRKRKPARFVVFELTDPAHREKGVELMVSEVAAGEAAAVLRSIDGIDHLEMLDEDHASVIVREKGQLRFKVLDLPARKVTEDHPIDIG